MEEKVERRRRKSGRSVLRHSSRIEGRGAFAYSWLMVGTEQLQASRDGRASESRGFWNVAITEGLSGFLERLRLSAHIKGVRGGGEPDFYLFSCCLLILSTPQLSKSVVQTGLQRVIVPPDSSSVTRLDVSLEHSIHGWCVYIFTLSSLLSTYSLFSPLISSPHQNLLRFLHSLP